MAPVYDPVVKRGLFETTFRGKTKRFRRIMSCDARWAAILAQGINYKTDGSLEELLATVPTVRQALSEVRIKVIEPTIRKSGPTNE